MRVRVRTFNLIFGGAIYIIAAIVWGFFGYALGNPEWALVGARYSSQASAVAALGISATFLTIAAMIFSSAVDVEGD